MLFRSHTLDIRLRVFGALTLIYTVVALVDTKIHTSGGGTGEDTTLNGSAKALETAPAPAPDPIPAETTTTVSPSLLLPQYLKAIFFFDVIGSRHISTGAR